MKSSSLVVSAFLALVCGMGPVVAQESVPGKPRIKVVPPDQATGLLKDLYAQSLHDHNKVYQYQKVLSLRPDILQLVNKQYDVLMLQDSELTQRERTFVIGAIAARNKDLGFASIHQQLGRSMHGGPRPDFKTGQYDAKRLPPRMTALLDYAVKLNQQPASVTDADLAALKQHGITDKGIVTLSSLVAFAKYVNTLTVAFGATNEPVNKGERIVRGRSYAIPFEYGDSQYDAIIAASNGLIYFAVCTHHLDHHAQFFAFNPKTKKVTHIADVGEVVGEKGKGAITQGKVHSNVFEYKGKLWFSTFKGYYGEDLKGRAPYPGGHFVNYNLATGEFTKLATIPDREGIPTCQLDSKNELLYGITYPSGHLYVYSLKTQKLRCIEKNKLEYGGKPSIDPMGRLYVSRPEGTMARFDPNATEAGAMRELGIDTRAAAWKAAASGAAVELLWKHAEGDQIYAMHYGTSSLSLFNPETNSFAPLARLSAGEKRKSRSNFRGTSPGLVRTPGGVFYHITVGAPFDDPPKRRLKYNCYLTSYDPAKRIARNHGPIHFENDQRLLFNAAGTLSHDKKSFCSIGWVEVSNPARIGHIKKLRKLSSPPETARKIYELRVIEVPIE